MVFCVHGLWYGRPSMYPMVRRLRKNGICAELFGYRSTLASMEGSALRLANRVRELNRPAGFLAHSLGGLLVLKSLSLLSGMAGGRAVLLGSPLRGSAAARRMRLIAPGRWILGNAGELLETGFSDIHTGWEVGMIAGTRRFGLGLFLGAAGEAGDGTVTLHETRVNGLADHLEIPVGHTGLLFSRAVFEASVKFLQTGQFRTRNAME